MASAVARVVADGVNASPSANGLPGAGFVQRLIDWTAQVGLWGSLAAMLVGAAVFGMSQQAGNYLGASRGKHLVLGGALGAAITGLAPTFVNLIFNASRA
ncbi:MAG TPA: hypothetical protein VG012_05445 [Acidimicrobiia bacterium]|nr:hypothetical protein [Acidimicrobiia bacterium]